MTKGKTSSHRAVRWDAEALTVVEGGVDLRCIKWNSIVRIAYATFDTSPVISDDHFLALDLLDEIVFISSSLEGALALEEAIEKRFGVKLGSQGRLANSVQDESVIIWPPSEVGQALLISRSSDAKPTTFYKLESP